MRKNAAAVSTIAISRVVPGVMPRSASTSSMISASSRTCSALSVLGSASASTRGPTAASMSRTAIRSGRLMRTTTSAPPRDTISAASGTSPLARSFSEAATLSSRSRMIASAPRLAAPSTKRRCVTGTNSSERHTGRSLVIINRPRQPYSLGVARHTISTGAISPRSRLSIMFATFCTDVAPIRRCNPSGGGPPDRSLRARN